MGEVRITDEMVDRAARKLHDLSWGETGDGKESAWQHVKHVAREQARAALSAALSGMAEPVKADELKLEWRDGAPPHPWDREWFIAETTYGDRAVLRPLPEEYTYDFTTADDTYIKRDKIKRWMQFPDSNYIAPEATPPASDLREENRWQPIETAPRDRTPILLGYEGWLHPVVGFYAITLGCWVEHGTKDPKANMATKWMPLPDLHAALNQEGK